MTDIEIALTNIGEIAARDIAKKEHPQGLNENMKVAARGGRVAKGARDVYEEETKTSALRKEISLYSPVIRSSLRSSFISIILAVMNILPIPGLDGGHIVLLFYEGITGRQPSDKAMEWIEKIGIFIIIALMVLALSNDVRNFILPLFGL